MSNYIQPPQRGSLDTISINSADSLIEHELQNGPKHRTSTIPTGGSDEHHLDKQPTNPFDTSADSDTLNLQTHDHDRNRNYSNSTATPFGNQHEIEEAEALEAADEVSSLRHTYAPANRARGNSSASVFFEGLKANKYVQKMYVQDMNDMKPKQQSLSRWAKFLQNVWFNDNAWMKSYLLVSMIFAVLILTLEAFLFGVYLANIGSINYINDPDEDTNNYDHNWVVTKRNAVATYLALYIYAEIYQVVLALITIYTRNIYHLVSSVGFLVAMCAYSGVQYSELHKTLINAEHQTWETVCQGISIAIIVIAIVLVINQAAIAWQLKDIFIQHTGEKTGMNTNLIKANMFFNLHRNAVLLSFFFFPAFTLQFIVIALKKSDPEFIITVIVLVLSLVLLVLADFCATRELLFPLVVLIVFYLAGIAYLLFKLVRLFTNYNYSGCHFKFR
ncbi:unnamed protein product [Ambrosiozyma monospora]|uniref:Unnamed protein product n=1 Tax=Ambrosiozyma monospora TaxID=43982 RepID=A0ACB5TD26_AMBMO|nr:unnamed protein product [Ambrosiozyma monospora]